MKRKTSPIRDTASERVFYAVNAGLLILLALTCLYPLLCIVSGAISSPLKVSLGLVTFYPQGFSLRGFQLVLRNASIVRGFGNSVFYTVFGTLLNVVFTFITGFALSRRELKGRNIMSFYMAFTMWFSGGLIPSYLLMRSLGLPNTIWVMLIPGLVSVWNVIVCRTFIQSTIPEELYEAASIDGCGYARYMVVIVAPLSKAILAVLSLWYAIGHWNSYFGALLYIYDKDLKPLSLFLREYLVVQQTMDLSGMDLEHESLGLVELMKNSLILMSCLPLWILYPFMQKFLVRGVMIGSVKG